MKQPHQTLRSLPMRAIAAAVAATLTSTPAFANPSGATVTSGNATISVSGSTLTVTNSPNTIINWHDFSIANGETTRFIQQSASSAVLNRVTGGNPSLILGTLQSNGRVFLINPSGIIFGAGSVVDVGGLVASTLDISNKDFLAGKHVYNANTVNAGNVVNRGEIRSASGGFVYLIGTQVENSGLINTPGGEAILAAGHSVEIVDSNDPALRVTVRAQSQDVNLSQLMLENNGNIFSVLNSGRVSANTVTKDATGKIHFKSAGTVETTAGSITEAKGSATLDGGYFQGFAETIGTYAGTIDASGRNGGFAETSGAAVNLEALDLNLRALSASGKGGHWLIDPTNITIDSTLADIIEVQLDNDVDVTINTFGAGTDAGNITVAADIYSYGNDVTLTLQANNNIIINSGITILAASADPLNLVLQADADGNGSGGIMLDYDTPGSVNLFTNGGDIVMGGGSNPLTGMAQSIVLENANIDTDGGNLTINGKNVTIDSGFLSVGNLKIKGGSGGTQLINGVELQASENGSITTSSLSISDNTELTVQGNLSVTASSEINLDNTAVVSADNVSITAGGALNLGSDSLIAASNNLTIKAETATLTNAALDAEGNLNLTVNSLKMANSSIGLLGGGTPTNIDITSYGNVVLSDGSEIIADQEIQMLIGGKLYLNSGGSGASHISTYSNNTIYLTFPTLFSGGYFLDGVEGVLFSPTNPFTGFFTGNFLNTPAILNTNLFITYAPLGAITDTVAQTTTTTQVTNPYLDPFGEGTTGPGDSSYQSEVSDPYPSRSPFAEVQECR
jgi:filamentous hemagglutinin family protein